MIRLLWFLDQAVAAVVIVVSVVCCARSLGEHRAGDALIFAGLAVLYAALICCSIRWFGTFPPKGPDSPEGDPPGSPRNDDRTPG